MTVAQQSGVTVVAGTGTQTVWTYPFIAVAPTYISVLYTDPAGLQSELTQGPGPGQYQVTMNVPLPGAIWGVGGTVAYNPNGTPIPPGSTLTISRTLPVAQPVSLLNLGSLETLGFGAESADDLIVLLHQQYTDALARALLMNPSNLAPPLPLPPAAQIAGQLAAFDASGNNMIATKILPQGLVSSVMQPVVAAASLFLGRQQLGSIGNISMQFFGGSGTYFPPAGLLFGIVECVGGGGGGGQAAGTGGAIAAGGGGSGGYSRSILSAAMIGTSQAVMVGDGGPPQGVGLVTSFGGWVTAGGGAAGEDNDGATIFGGGGDGGFAGIGQLALAGNAGGFGFAGTTVLTSGATPLLFALGGAGGAMFGGNNGSVLATPGSAKPGVAGVAGGGGGGGAQSGSTQSAAGGNGGRGWCLITEFSA